jgi:hypothetical protein
VKLYLSALGKVSMSLGVGMVVGSASAELSQQLGQWPSSIVSTITDSAAAFLAFTAISWRQNRKSYKGEDEKISLGYALKANRNMGAIFGACDLLYLCTRSFPTEYFMGTLKPYAASLIADICYYVPEALFDAFYCRRMKKKAMDLETRIQDSGKHPQPM